MSNSTPRFGLIGTGIWVRDVQAPVAAASKAVRLTAIYGRNHAAAAEIAATYGVSHETELDRFFDKVDIVGVALPPSAQPEFAMAAIAARKHVILEKPISLDVQSALQIADGLDAKGLKSLVFFTPLINHRNQTWLADMRAVGGWSGGRVDAFSGVLVDPANPFHSTAQWRSTIGALWDTTPHAVAMLVQIFGPVAEVSASEGIGDLKAVVLKHRDGGLTTINIAQDMPPSVMGETVIYGRAGKRALPTAVFDWKSNSRLVYDEALVSLVASISGHQTTHPDARFGAYVTAVLSAAERSIAERRTVTVD